MCTSLDALEKGVVETLSMNLDTSSFAGFPREPLFWQKFTPAWTDEDVLVTAFGGQYEHMLFFHNYYEFVCQVAGQKGLKFFGAVLVAF